MTTYLDLEVIYDIKTDSFKFDGTVKPERQGDLIMEFIRSQMGTGKDASPVNEVDIYKITLRWYPDGDRFGVTHNCGNKGLREGLLLEAARRLQLGAPR